MSLARIRLLLLAATLLLGQAGSLLHGLAHFAHDQGEPQSPCELCVAYAGLDSALRSTADSLPAIATTLAKPGPSPDGIRVHVRTAYHPRAPPAPLV